VCVVVAVVTSTGDVCGGLTGDVGTSSPPPAAMHRLTGGLGYNRDKIVYTCAIVANIRRDNV